MEEEEKKKKKGILILHGSATGTAEDLSDELLSALEEAAAIEEAEQMNVVSFNMDTFDRSQLIDPEWRLCIFLCSTTGDGEVPSSMMNFWKFLLRKNLPLDVLEGMNFGVFGLGDSGYSKFNNTAKKLRARLIQLGAKEVIPMTLGDDMSPLGVEGDFDVWKKSALEPVLKSMFNITFQKSSSIKSLHPRKIRKFSLRGDFLSAPSGAFPKPTLVPSILQVNTLLTEQNWRMPVHHFEFTTSSALTYSYSPGDIAYLYPENPLEDCKRFLARLKFDPSDICEISLTNHPHLTKISRLEACVKSLDILGVPKRSFFKYAAPFCSSDEEKERMLELSQIEGNDLYANYCKRENRSYLEVLIDFPSCMIPWEYVVDLIPEIQARAFSISSSPGFHGQSLHLCIAIVRYVTPWKRQKKGLCSNWLSGLTPKDAINLWIGPGPLKFNLEAPMILIGPGTGIASMRSILYEKIAKSSHGIAQDRLYFGCRHKEKDYLYKDDLSKIFNIKENQLRVAFSRDDPTGKKHYVMELLAKDRKILIDLLMNHNAAIRISGAAKRMPNDVRETFIQMFMLELNLDRESSENEIKKLEKQARYQVECY